MTTPVYEVHSTIEKVYIEGKKGCIARLCVVSAEFYEPFSFIVNCSFKRFQEEALKFGYVVDDKHRPPWDKKKEKV
jgi:hypothetical protein